MEPLDLVTLWVYQFPDLTMDLRVSPEGCVSVPVVGKLRAAGRLPEAVAEEIRAGLETRLKLRQTQVTLMVKEYALRYAYIYGGVKTPRDLLLPRDRPLTLSQGVALAEGLTNDAAPAKTRVVRQEAGKSREERTVDLLAVMDGGKPELDLALRPGDSIYVPQERNGIYLVGAVLKPGYVDLTAFSAPHRSPRPVTASQALALGGGLTEGALAREARVLRAKDGSSTLEAIPVDLEALVSGRSSTDVALKPGDTLFVPYGEGVFVLGQVAHSGLQSGLLYPSPGGPLTVTKAISMAGGFTPLAASSKVRLLRKDSVTQVDVDHITKSEPAADPVLAPGDIIYVPRGL